MTQFIQLFTENSVDLMSPCIYNVTSIMVNGNVTMDQALDLIGVQGKERTLIIDAINKRQK